MDLLVSGAFAKKLMRLASKDSQLTVALAQEWASRVDRQALTAYLLDAETAVRLLAERLKQDPEKTLDELQRLEARQGKRRAASRGTAEPATASARRRRGRPIRMRLSASQLEETKQLVRAFLGRNPWANRKQISEAARGPTPALYARIMGELKDAGEIIGKGEKAKAVYALKGTGAGAGRAANGKPRGKGAAAPATKKGRPGRPKKAASTTK